MYKTIWVNHLKPQFEEANQPTECEFLDNKFDRKDGFLAHGTGYILKSINRLVREKYGNKYGIVPQKPTRPTGLRILEYQVRRANEQSWLMHSITKEEGINEEEYQTLEKLTATA